MTEFKEKITAKYGIVVSEKDIAGLNIYKKLLEKTDYTEEAIFEKNPVYRIDKETLLIKTTRDLLKADHLDSYFDIKYWIFASKHKSESKIPTFTVHSPGNWTSDNLYGGKPETLAYTNFLLIKKAITSIFKLHQKTTLPHKVSLEVTHHGPTELEKPCVFIELGSHEKHWIESDAASLLADAILEIIHDNKKYRFKAALGFGGGHYPEKFTNICIFSEYGTGHIMPKYVSDKIDIKIIREAIKKNNQVDIAIFDWKGLRSKIRTAIIQELSKNNIEFIKTSDISLNNTPVL